MKRLVALAILVGGGLLLSGCFPWTSETEGPILTATLISGTYTVRFAVVNVAEQQVVSIDWFFGDGTQELGTQELEIIHEYSTPGSYTVTAILQFNPEQPGGDGRPGPEALAPLATPSEVILTITVELPPIKPIEILDLTGEAIVSPPWWEPREHGENEFPQGVPIQFTADWRDNVPKDDIQPYKWGWWAVQVDTGRTVASKETSDATWVCPGDVLVCTGGCGQTRETPYRIIVVMYCTNGHTERYEETITVVPSL